MTYVLLMGEHPFITDSKLDADKQRAADWSFLEQKAVSPELQLFLVQTGHHHKYSRLPASSALLHPFITRRPLDDSELEQLYRYYEDVRLRREENKRFVRLSLKSLV